MHMKNASVTVEVKGSHPNWLTSYSRFLRKKKQPIAPKLGAQISNEPIMDVFRPKWSDMQIYVKVPRTRTKPTIKRLVLAVTEALAFVNIFPQYVNITKFPVNCEVKRNTAKNIKAGNIIGFFNSLI